ncbi:TPA: hypothetical protein vir249_00040 [Ariesvirus gravis]|uniref:Uncharacterized protein n=1 Tax=Caudoviricetes sp. vir249 TaxID=3068355 RepID=A0AA87CIG0_9CAUD|nr:TPA_asm: hypothetical protein vir249_00040 [Caudoviricetes sp. vir249]
MIDEKLLISYLKEQKREYNEQVVILQKELTSSLMYNHKQEYIIKKLMYESMMNIICIYENLIERIESGEFDVIEDPKKEDKKMKIDKISKKISEGYKKQELNRQEFLTRILKPTNPYERETQLEKAYEFIEDFTRQINRSIMVENQILITELNNIKKLLNDLYEGIDEYYTETLERNDELAVARADAELQLIKKIIDKVEKI